MRAAILTLLLTACGAGSPTAVPEPATRPAEGSEADHPSPGRFEPEWNTSTLNGLIIPVPESEMDAAETLRDERGHATGRIRYEGRIVAIPYADCEATLRDPPGPLTVSVTLRALADEPGAAELVECLNELATRIPLGVYFRETEQTWVPLTGMTMLRVPTLEDLREQRALRHLVVTERADFTEIRGLADLEVLDAFARAASGEGLDTLTGLRWLRFRPEEPGQLRHIARLPRLEHVDLLGAFLDQSDVDALAGMTALRFLSLRGVASWQPLDLSVLSGATELKHLDLREMRVGDDPAEVPAATLEVLRALPHLEELVVDP